jgi:hypothetical protein
MLAIRRFGFFMMVLTMLSCGGTHSSVSCPKSASQCPVGCLAVEGYPVDVTNHCTGQAQAVACISGSTISTDAPCARRTSDGALFLLPGSGIQAPDWARCTGSDADQVTLLLGPCK